MSSFARFFREHLKRFLPLIVGGSVLLSLAGLCQGAMIAIIQLVFSLLLGMGRVHGAAQNASAEHLEKLTLYVQLKGWALAHLPSQATLQHNIYLLPALLVLVFVMKGVFTYSGTLLMVRSGIRATISLRERLFGHLLRQEPAFFQTHPVGELLQRCITDVGAVQGIASNQLADAVREITQAMAMLGYVMFLN